MTITEALAELKTISKRLTKKKKFVFDNLVRNDNEKDPFEKDGGAYKLIEQEVQSIKDLEQRVVRLRSAIMRANLDTELTIQGETMSIYDWLVWRKEVASSQTSFYETVGVKLNTFVKERRQRPMVHRNEETGATEVVNLITNFSEKEAQKQADFLEEIYGLLDGQLSLKNATVQISI